MNIEKLLYEYRRAIEKHARETHNGEASTVALAEMKSSVCALHDAIVQTVETATPKTLLCYYIPGHDGENPVIGFRDGLEPINPQVGPQIHHTPDGRTVIEGAGT